jgi:uncharacterized protein YdhG (YjbR/CyaY superfamily)
MASDKPRDIDTYLATVSPGRRKLLAALRAAILAELPNAVECISYSMPAFRYEGHVVAGFLATAKGCSYFPFSGTTLDSVAAKIEGFGRTKSALHFDANQPLDPALVRTLLRARLAEIPKKKSARGGSGSVRSKKSAQPGLKASAKPKSDKKAKTPAKAKTKAPAKSTATPKRKAPASAKAIPKSRRSTRDSG